MSGWLINRPAAVLPGDQALVLARLVACELRSRGERGAPVSTAEMDAYGLLVAVARAWLASDAASVGASDVDPPVSDVGVSTWLSTKVAAQRLGIGQRAVVDAVARGALTARRSDRGRGWQVSERAVESYAARRNRTRREGEVMRDAA